MFKTKKIKKTELGTGFLSIHISKNLWIFNYFPSPRNSKLKTQRCFLLDVKAHTKH